jgi:hypothetical protein
MMLVLLVHVGLLLLEERVLLLLLVVGVPGAPMW